MAKSRVLEITKEILQNYVSAKRLNGETVKINEVIGEIEFEIKNKPRKKLVPRPDVFQNPKGYVMVRLPADHEFSQMANGGFVAEHRLKMALLLKRSLTKQEVVHHINGIKNDNREENLQLLEPNRHNLITLLERG